MLSSGFSISMLISRRRGGTSPVDAENDSFELLGNSLKVNQIYCGYPDTPRYVFARMSRPRIERIGARYAGSGSQRRVVRVPVVLEPARPFGRRWTPVMIHETRAVISAWAFSCETHTPLRMSPHSLPSCLPLLERVSRTDLGNACPRASCVSHCPKIFPRLLILFSSTPTLTRLR